MELGDLDNTKNLEALHPLFAEAFAYLKNTDFTSAPVGKTELKDKELYVMVSDSKMKDADSAKLEVHDKYIDIQMPVSKMERFGWKNRSELKTPSVEYNAEKDIQFFDDESPVLLDVAPGNFVVFFPEDAHAPCIGEGTIRKVVVKVKL